MLKKLNGNVIYEIMVYRLNYTQYNVKLSTKFLNQFSFPERDFETL